MQEAGNKRQENKENLAYAKARLGAKRRSETYAFWPSLWCRRKP